MINGTTVHSGLGISIKNGAKPAERRTSSYVQVSVKNKNEMRAEWRDVDVVLIDEVSMVSLNLLGDIDHALRYVKEKQDQWFGGILVIFSGDLYQYPPVGAPPLYSSISPNASMSDKELQKRIGALAWNSVSDVVELTEQHRMKDDPEYAAAVLRLRTRECTVADATLFNSRLIKSQTNPGGISLHTERALKGVAIVPTNNERKALNLLKARANCTTESENELNMCEALDILTVSKAPVPNEMPSCDRDKLLRIDLTKKHNNSLNLPGVIPLYVGMPVVLREKNISTDLGITNGATGVVEHITFKPFAEVGTRLVVDVVFVRFWNCSVQLSGLPIGVIPLTPVPAGFEANINMGKKANVSQKIVRHQVCIQPGFAVTGHSAQGQTLLFVITDLSAGGFASYVSASRPKTREGLAITKEVSVNDLNQRVHKDLKAETRRLAVLAYNTKVKYGQEQGEMKAIPSVNGLNVDPCSDPKVAYATAVNGLRVDYIDTVEKKNKPVPGSARNDEGGSRKRKRRRTEASEHTLNQLPNPPAPSSVNNNMPGWMSYGCTWKSDYSCAYDAAVMSLCNSYWSGGELCKDTLRTLNDITRLLCDAFEQVFSMHGDSRNCFNTVRDRLRSLASTSNPQLFPRNGPALVPIGELLELVLTGNAEHMMDNTVFPSVHCNICGEVDCSSFELQYGIGGLQFCGSILSVPDEDSMKVIDGRPMLITQSWLNSLKPFAADFYSATSNYHSFTCRSSLSYAFRFVRAPSILRIEVPFNYLVGVAPSLTISAPVLDGNSTFSLSSMVVLKTNHYWCYLITGDQLTVYDGQICDGTPVRKGRVDSVFSVHDGSLCLPIDCRPCVFIYALAD